MVLHGAGGVGAAHSRTRVHTVLLDAGQVPWALGVHHALRLALDVRVAGVVQDAGAAGRTSHVTAHGVGAAWRRVARLHDFNRQYCACKHIKNNLLFKSHFEKKINF